MVLWGKSPHKKGVALEAKTKLKEQGCSIPNSKGWAVILSHRDGLNTAMVRGALMSCSGDNPVLETLNSEGKPITLLS